MCSTYVQTTTPIIYYSLHSRNSVLGFISTICASAGNVRNASPLLMVVSICAVVIFILIPFFINLSVGGVVSTEKNNDGMNQVLCHLSVIWGFVLLIDPVMYVFQRLLPANSFLSAFVQNHMDNTRLEASVKWAAGS